MRGLICYFGLHSLVNGRVIILKNGTFGVILECTSFGKGKHRYNIFEFECDKNLTNREVKNIAKRFYKNYKERKRNIDSKEIEYYTLINIFE